MQGKILVFSLVLSLIIFYAVAQDVDDDDEDFDNYKANLLNAVETLDKNLNSRDVRHLQKRGWFKKVWKNVLKPAITSAAVKYVAGVLVGKRTFDDIQALNHEAREWNETQCEKDAAQFQDVKQAASKLCALTKFPDLKCP